MDADKIKLLETHKEDLQKGIWILEVDVRFLERKKVTARDSELGEIQHTINRTKEKIELHKERIELIEDILTGK